MKKFEDAGIRVEVLPLELGDFIWIARPKATSSNDGKPHLKHRVFNILADFDDVVLGHVVERKREDDLTQSIVDGRFREQKALPSQLSYFNV